jgi:hypothetical protein
MRSPKTHFQHGEAMLNHMHRTGRSAQVSLHIGSRNFVLTPEPQLRVQPLYSQRARLSHSAHQVPGKLKQIIDLSQVAAMELGKVLGKGPLPLECVRIGDTGSDMHPNAGATWSSTGSESACGVRHSCCLQGRHWQIFGLQRALLVLLCDLDPSGSHPLMVAQTAINLPP